jgi:tetratricopeptide (TPR) repeat protein
VVFIVIFAAATHARSSAWSSWDLLLAQAVLEQRDSPRLNAMYGASLLERGDLAGAIAQFERVPRTGVYAPVVPMWIILATCMANEAVDDRLISEWEQARPNTIGTNALQSVRALTTEIENHRCRGLDAARALPILDTWTAHLDNYQPRSRHWRMRYYAARLAATSGQWPAALTRAREAAIDSDDNLDALVLWFQIASSAQALADARSALDRLRVATPDWHYQLQEALQRFEASLAAAPDSPPMVDPSPPASEPARHPEGSR